MNRAFRSFRAGRLVSTGSLAKRILGIGGLRGVTYSGGEPFEQALPLAELSRRLHRAGLSVAAYSGYSREALHQAPERFACLLDEIDVLIDGEYQRDVMATSPWAGSGNQRIHLLTRLAIEEGWTTVRNSPSIEISLDENGISITGLSSATDRLLRQRLRSRGILIGTRTRQ
jgi:anaerobic ribonucleoside-triphosphate reductase activating protein